MTRNALAAMLALALLLGAGCATQIPPSEQIIKAVAIAHPPIGKVVPVFVAISCENCVPACANCIQNMSVAEPYIEREKVYALKAATANTSKPCGVMRRSSITAFAVAILAMMLSASSSGQEAKVPAKPAAHIGFLSCHVASGWGLVFGSSRKLRCTYSPTDKAKASEQYTVSISRFGTDIGYVQSGVIMWSVYAPETQAATNPGFLAGRYQGQTASATLGTGVGLKNAMVGGPGRSIELHPMSIEGSEGLNLAAGVATIDLKFSPTVSHS